MQLNGNPTSQQNLMEQNPPRCSCRTKATKLIGINVILMDEMSAPCHEGSIKGARAFKEGLYSQFYGNCVITGRRINNRRLEIDNMSKDVKYPLMSASPV